MLRGIDDMKRGGASVIGSAKGGGASVIGSVKGEGTL